MNRAAHWLSVRDATRTVPGLPSSVDWTIFTDWPDLLRIVAGPVRIVFISGLAMPPTSWRRRANRQTPAPQKLWRQDEDTGSLLLTLWSYAGDGARRGGRRTG